MVRFMKQGLRVVRDLSTETYGRLLVIGLAPDKVALDLS